MTDTTFHPRFAEASLTDALADTPVVLVHGPRQCGKTTLARRVGDAKQYAYFSFDDDVARAAAEADPLGFVSDLPERAILDEVLCHVLLRSGVLIVLASLTIACNSILGVEDVSSLDCHVNADYAIVMSNASTSLSHVEGNNSKIPQLIFGLDTNTKSG